MQFIDVTTDGSLSLNETTKPTIENDECLIKVKAIGVNRADILQRAGKYPPPKGESTILGIEVSGEIVECGQDVKSWQVTDRVCCLVAGGGYAEYVKVKAVHLIAIPTQHTYQQGAAIAEVFLTAYQCLFTIAALKPQQNVLIHAGASGVGSAAIQLAKSKDCYVVVTTSNDEKCQACLSLGADQAINYRTTDFVTWSKDNKVKFDVILDVVAGDYIAKNINVAALDAKIVILSMLAGRYAEQIDIAKLLQKRISLQATTLRNRSIDYKKQLVDKFTDDFFQLLLDEKVLPVIDRVYSWHDIELAHQRMLDNLNIGKIVLTVD